MKWHTAELLVHTSSWEARSEPRKWGGRVGENCRSPQLSLAILPGTGSSNAAGERELLDWHEPSTTALVSCSPSHGRVQRGPRCNVLVRGHRSAEVAYESTVQFHSPVNEPRAVFVMLTADI